MFWLFYNLVFVTVFTLLLPHFYLRMRRRGGYRKHFMQRLGRYSSELRQLLAEGDAPIWIHAVSVGEVQVALKFMERWRLRHPEARFVLSVTTSTASVIARGHVTEADAVIYFPVDLPLVMRRVVNTLRPRALILVEAEIWPNLVRRLKRKHIPVVLINGRLSDRSYHRMRKARMLTRRVMPLIDLCCMQSEEEARRVIELGAIAERVKVLHSAKYEVAERNAKGEAAAREVMALAGFRADHRILFGGSTWPGEERILVDVFKRIRESHPALKLVLVPRHVERIPEILRELEADGLRLVRRSEITAAAGTEADLFILDTTGELMNFYSVADFIFVGKSLCEQGGQNIMEPALLGKPIVVGPHMQNFPRVMDDFREAQAILQVADEAGLEQAVQRWLEDETPFVEQGARAGALMKEKAGTLTHSVELVDALVGTAS